MEPQKKFLEESRMRRRYSLRNSLDDFHMDFLGEILKETKECRNEYMEVLLIPERFFGGFCEEIHREITEKICEGFLG